MENYSAKTRVASIALLSKIICSEGGPGFKNSQSVKFAQGLVEKDGKDIFLFQHKNTLSNGLTDVLGTVVILETPQNRSRANSPRVITKITQLPITSAGPQQTDANLVPDCAESLPSKSIKEEQMVYTKNTTITYIEIIQVPPVPFSPECCLEMLGDRAAAEVGFKRLMDIVTSRYGLDEHYMEENKEAYNDAREEAKKQWDKKEADEGTMRNEAKMPAPQKM
ncbi:hypothetical protein KEM48_012778 [Puccinia striiformis f. sp. tritici PST-130]|nr:hypothetical protein KEM48_012778 [Puccinia striiformis f. sp. tritici PST-130]